MTKHYQCSRGSHPRANQHRGARAALERLHAELRAKGVMPPKPATEPTREDTNGTS